MQGDKILSEIKTELVDCKYHSFLLGNRIRNFQKWENRINIFLAIMSSGGIAAWAIWENYAFVWACLIALSQLLNTIRPYIPLGKYIHKLNSKCYRQENLFLELDFLYADYNDGTLNKVQAKASLRNIKKHLNENEFFDDDDDFNFSSKDIEQATKQNRDFFKSKYSINI
ncbi:MAG: hypothetical protein IJE15_03380 [Bacteroidaceae bacterium]|nr:hypothetical protein [Bacteroidaceae bacterium]